MKAVLLAAGLGTRLRPLTNILPKCLMPINGRPLLDFWLHDLLKIEVDGILVNTHYHAEIVGEWLRSSRYGDRLRTSHETELLGTGGTLLKNREFLGNGPVLVAHADNLCQVDLPAFVTAHKARPSACVMTMMTFKTETPKSCGIVKLDQDGVVKGFYEKVDTPPGDLANAAIYILEPEVFSFLASLDKERVDFSTEVIPHFVGRIFSFFNDQYLRDIGSVADYLQAQLEFPGGIMESGRENDAWHSICRQQGLTSDGRFVKALAGSISIMSMPDEMKTQQARKNMSPEPLIVTVPENCVTDEEIIRFVEHEKKNSDDEIFLFFPCSRRDFSSKDFYQKYGFKSLVFCQ